MYSWNSSACAKWPFKLAGKIRCRSKSLKYQAILKNLESPAGLSAISFFFCFYHYHFQKWERNIILGFLIEIAKKWILLFFSFFLSLFLSFWWFYASFGRQPSQGVPCNLIIININFFNYFSFLNFSFLVFSPSPAPPFCFVCLFVLFCIFFLCYHFRFLFFFSFLLSERNSLVWFVVISYGDSLIHRDGSYRYKYFNIPPRRRRRRRNLKKNRKQIDTHIKYK